MKYSIVALLFSLLVSSLSVNILYIDMLNKINEMDSIKDQKIGIIQKEVLEIRDMVE